MITGTNAMADALEKTMNKFRSGDVMSGIRCPYLLVFGEHDWLGIDQVNGACRLAKDAGLDVALKIFTAEDTGAEHCQTDNPTIGQEYIFDWPASVLNIEQNEMARRAGLL